jgi:predicted RNase H-like HicB family nuclease
MKISYPATFEEDGDYIFVQFPDIPEAMTQGITVQEAYAKAREVLELALDGKQDLPEATAVDALERKYPNKTVTLIKIDSCQSD